MENHEKLHNIRHTLAHLLAMATKEFDPGVKLGIGPVTDDGFYYDFQFTKAPTAELRTNQTDQDKLPPYEKLDKILNKYVEEHLPLKEIIKNGLSPDLVQSVCNMIDTSEYKREQAAPGLKLTSRSFGYGWRMPIAQKYREQI